MSWVGLCSNSNYVCHAGHIQIAQVPDRHEPDSPGEINFPYIFKLLEELGYQGYVGCEYKPLGECLTMIEELSVQQYVFLYFWISQ